MNVFTFIAIKKKFKILIQTNVQALPGIWQISWPGRAFDKYPDQAWLTGSLGVAGCLSLNLPWVTGCWALVGDPQWPCQPLVYSDSTFAVKSSAFSALLSNNMHSFAKYIIVKSFMTLSLFFGDLVTVRHIPAWAKGCLKGMLKKNHRDILVESKPG